MAGSRVSSRRGRSRHGRQRTLHAFYNVVKHGVKAAPYIRRALRSRRARTQTRTKTKRTRGGRKQHHVGAHAAFVTNFVKRWRKKKAAGIFKSITNPVTTDDLSTLGLTGAPGRQQCGTIGWMTGAELSTLGLGAMTINYVRNPDGTPDYGKILPAMGASLGNNVNKFMMSSYKTELRITNQAPSVAEIDIYLCVSRITQPTYVNPEALWASALDNADGQIGVLGQGINQPYLTPTRLKQFNLAWKVEKKYAVTLEVGRQWIMNHSFLPNAILDTAYTTSYAQIRGITRAILVVARGTVADSNPGFSAGTITTTPVKLVMTLRKRATCQGVFQKSMLYAQSGTLHTVNLTDPTGKLLVQCQEEDEVIDTLDPTKYA